MVKAAVDRFGRLDMALTNAGTQQCHEALMVVIAPG
jgi:hypothetical protein